MFIFFFFHEAKDFKVGQRCQIVSMHHPCFYDLIGKAVIIAKIIGESVLAYDDKPVSYRINNKGQRVVDIDPRCIQSVYGFDQIKIIEEGVDK